MAEYVVVDTKQLDADLSSIADAIRTKGGTSESLEFPQGFINSIGAISGGGTEEIENIIDQSGVLGTTDGTATATEKVAKLIHFVEVFKKTFGLNFYSSKTLTHIDFYIDWLGSGYNTGTLAFQYASNLKFLRGIDVTKLANCRDMFSSCMALETIEMPFDMSKNTAWGMAGMFSGCSSLVDVSFVAESIKGSITIPSPVLSAESIQSIIDGLATVETAQTLTLHKDVKAKLTETQLATITNKNWNLA